MKIIISLFLNNKIFIAGNIKAEVYEKLEEKENYGMLLKEIK